MFLQKVAATVIAVFITTVSCWSQTIISYTLLKSFSKQQVDSLLTANSIPASALNTKYGVNFYKVLYRTPYKHPDSLVQASGAVVLPQNATCNVPLVIYSHGTESNASKVASTFKGAQWEVGVGLAASGFAMALTDFLGMGDKDPKVLMHPYQHAFHEANTGINMLRATREVAQSESVGLNGQVFLFGYSQGGYVTTAICKEIQQKYSHEFTIAGAVPMSGSYDLDGAQYDLMKSNDPYPTPGYLPFLTLGYQSVGVPLFTVPSDIFKSPYDTVIPPKLYSGTVGIGTLNGFCNPVPKLMFKDSIVNAIFSDSNHVFRQALRDNNLVKGWVPQFPIRLFYCSGDEQVSPQNTVVAYNTWQAGGAPNLAKSDFGNLSHGNCAQLCFLAGKTFIDSLKQDCTTGIKETGSAAIQLFPNPANDVVRIAFTNGVKPMSIEVWATDGRLVVYADKLVSNIELNVAQWQSGLYAAVITTDKGKFTKTFMVSK
ncbi:MAG: T9SS type A sorting domain-containing protein [Chitinophagales bacterium]|nr:T9SS type A sorting domain-containing protein [Chitinophagales bacterium]